MNLDERRASEAKQWFRDVFGLEFDNMPDDWRTEMIAGRPPEQPDRWCGKCRFFQGRANETHGECRARTPKVNPANWNRSFPVVARSAWCNYFRPIGGVR